MTLPEFLDNLPDKLQPKTTDNTQEITIFIVDDPSINAFAGPGGYIGIHTGLILASRTEGELASVIAHEIAHVTQRHLVRSFEASNKMSLQTMGALIAAILLGSNNPNVGEAVLASTVAGNAQKQLTFSRAHEQEADRVGLELLANADFDPRMMVSFFNVLQQQNRVASSNTPEFLLTHPLTLARIADTQNRANQYPEFAPRDNTSFQLIQARTASLSKSKNAPNPFSDSTITPVISNAAVEYYEALNSLKSSEYDKARHKISSLLKADNHRALFHLTAAEIELADNHPEQARKILSTALRLFPDSAPLTGLYTEALMQLHKPQQAFNLLKSTLRQHPEQVRFYQSYAKAAKMLGNDVESYRALAEYQYAMGDIRQAIEYISQALKVGAMDKYDRLSLEARLKALQSEAIDLEHNDPSSPN